MANVSKEHLQRQLADARVASAIDHSESAGVDVAGRIDELRVIENVEKFGSELDTEALCDPRVLQQRHIKVVDSGTMEETPRGGVQDTQRLQTE